MEKAILCVDDEIIILMSLKQELRMAFGSEFLYETARDGLEALEVVDELAGDGISLILVISDWLMPGLTGDELIMKIKGKYPGIKAIIITGQADEGKMDEMKKEDCLNAVIRKPWSNAGLIETIRSCLAAAESD